MCVWLSRFTQGESLSPKCVFVCVCVCGLERHCLSVCVRARVHVCGSRLGALAVYVCVGLRASVSLREPEEEGGWVEWGDLWRVSTAWRGVTGLVAVGLECIFSAFGMICFMENVMRQKHCTSFTQSPRSPPLLKSKQI